MSDIPTLFTGWVRNPPRGQWRAVCHGATEAECYARLLATKAPPGADRMVTAPGRHPNDARKPR